MRQTNLSRRHFGAGLAAIVTAGVTASVPTPAAAQASVAVSIRRFAQTEPFPVNAFIVEAPDRLVVIDALLTETASRALRAEVDTIGKPLAAVLLTHPHPDHYAGLGNLVDGLDVPILSVAGVNDVARRDDDAKNDLIGGMFGPEWPSRRVFPTDIVADGEILRFGGIEIEVHDIGPAESFHDSAFVLRGANRAFVGDLAFGLMHPYMADNHNPDWTRALERLGAELPEDTVLHVGHGGAVTPGFLVWQATYLEKFEQAILAADWRDRVAAQAAVTAAMRDYLPGDDDLLFLMQLSIMPNAERLGVL
jgi:glyoxylase-like metal-dependent hydrolase (beta-lactamase superfamily II)